MSFAEPLRAAALAVALSTSLILSGCTLTPVYGDAATVQSAYALQFASPNTRQEQIAYQTLSARFAAGDATTPLVSIAASVSNSRLGVSDVPSPLTDRQATATLTYTVTRDGQTLSSGTRTASANYQTTGQYLADDNASANAGDQAIRAAAESVRLALLAALAPR